jgi:protein-tyrosine phosphatase
LEFPHSQIPVGSINLVQWLIQRQVVPMIAHPERNRELLARPDKLSPFLQAGCLTQVTAGSLIGKFGPGARAFGEYLLQAGCVTLLATDCHNLAYRPPELGAGRDAAAALIGETAARRLVEENPQQILDSVSGDRNRNPQ